MSQQVHIVGISPRTGTTLMSELMIHCFDFNGYADHELSFYYQPVTSVDRLCTKKPSDLRLTDRALKWRSDLWVICMVRDPRDVIVSRHKKSPDHYWSNLGIIKRRLPYLRKAQKHRKFITIRYEDLVSEPDRVQQFLQSKISFLKRTAAFSNYHEVVRPTEGSIEALSGVRPISTQSIGRWRSELPRIKAQIQEFGSIDNLLHDFGYENNGDWINNLDMIVADNGKSYFENTAVSRIRRIIRECQESVLLFRQRLGCPAQTRIITRESDIV